MSWDFERRLFNHRPVLFDSMRKNPCCSHTTSSRNKTSLHSHLLGFSMTPIQDRLRYDFNYVASTDTVKLPPHLTAPSRVTMTMPQPKIPLRNLLSHLDRDSSRDRLRIVARQVDRRVRYPPLRRRFGKLRQPTRDTRVRDTAGLQNSLAAYEQRIGSHAARSWTDRRRRFRTQTELSDTRTVKID